MSQHTKFTIDLNEEFPPLATAPVVEAVIHWQAQATDFPGEDSLQEKLQESLPDYPHCEKIQALTAEAVFTPDGISPEFQHRAEWQGFRLRNEQSTYVAHFTSQGVIFSRLQPYEKWTSFVAEAKRVWGVFVEIAKPVIIQRLGVRYINRIPIEHGVQPSVYLNNVRPHLTQFDFPVESFLYQDVYRIPGYQYSITWTCTREPPNPNSLQGALILDIDVYTNEPIQLDQGILDQKLLEMRWLKDKTFFSCITEPARKEFGG
jgi:uncharacterized protein (TIGR04255 family)